MEKKQNDGKPVSRPKSNKNVSSGKKVPQGDRPPMKKTSSNKPTPSSQIPKKKPVKSSSKAPVHHSGKSSTRDKQIARNVSVRNNGKMTQNEVDTKAEEMLNKPKKSKSPKDKIYSKPLTPAKAPISPYKRRIKRILFYVATVAVLVVICGVLSLTVFFQIDNIEVQGETRYDVNDIITSSGINKGDNLILCNTGDGEEQIQKDFPYIESVDIKKKLLNTIVIQVAEAKPASIIESSGLYVVLSKSGKIIEIAGTKKYDVPTILGANLKDVELSSSAEYKDENVKKYIEEIIAAVSDNNIKNVETVDISNLSKITLIRDNGFKIVIGRPENIDYKLKTAKAIMDKSVNDTDTGTLDVSLASPDGGKSYLRDDKYESSQEISEQSTEENSKQTSEESTKESTEENSEQTSEENSEESSEQTSEESTEESSKQTSEENPEESSEQTSEENTDENTEDSSEEINE